MRNVKCMGWLMLQVWCWAVGPDGSHCHCGQACKKHKQRKQDSPMHECTFLANLIMSHIQQLFQRMYRQASITAIQHVLSGEMPV